VSLVGVGHGMAGNGRLAPIHMVADMVHLLCAMTWIGGLFFLGLVVHQIVKAGAAARTGAPSDTQSELDALRRVLRRFSHIGYGAVALLVGSGCINALILVPQPDKLIGTDYGRVLLVKIALALLDVGVAGERAGALAQRRGGAGDRVSGARHRGGARHHPSGAVRAPPGRAP
jgi:putative copper resistance protein D